MKKTHLYYVFIIAIFALMGCDYGYTATDQKLVKCLIGESEQKKDMVATAEAMLNRIQNMGYDIGLRGVYGCEAVELNGSSFYRGSRKIPTWVVRNAEKALVEARTSNLVHGADHWENIEAFGVPSWAKGANKLRKVVKVGSHTFFKKQ